MSRDSVRSHRHEAHRIEGIKYIVEKDNKLPLEAGQGLGAEDIIVLTMLLPTVEHL